MAKTARAAIEDLLTCESCHAFYYVERAEDGARTRLRCTSCGHSRDVLLSGAKTDKWTVIDPNGEVKTFTEWDELIRTMSGSVVTAVRAKLPSDKPVSNRAASERPPVATRASSERPVDTRPGSNRPAPSPAAVEVPPMHEVQPIGPSVGPVTLDGLGAAPPAESSDEEEAPVKSQSGAALLDVTPSPIGPKLSLADSSPTMPATESDKSIEVSLSEPALPAVPESRPEALVAALVDSMPEASVPPIEKTADIAPVEAKPQEHWDDDEAEVLSMKDIQVVPVVESDPSIQTADIILPERQTAPTPPPPARGALRTLPPPARFDAPPPPTITFDEHGKRSDPPPETAAKKSSDPPAKVGSEKPKALPKSDPPKTEKNTKKSDVAVTTKDRDSRAATTVPPKRAASNPVATAKVQVAPSEESGGRSWLLPAVGVAAAAGVVWWLASGSGATTPQPQTNTTAPTTTTTAPPPTTTTTTTTAENKPIESTTTTTATTTATTAAPTVKAASPSLKPADVKPATTGETPPTTDKKPVGANLSMAEALDKAGQTKRAGDFATAKELYAKVLRESPTNVEAHSGLGDIAKAQGDLAGAKASYQKALASSPDYGPAMLALADVEWDMGDRAAATAHYAKIVAARGGSAPDRAKQRAGGEAN